MKTKQLTLKIAGALATLLFTNGMKDAHGTGFDGKTKVKSLKYAKPDQVQSESDIAVEDSHGNAIYTNPDEVLALAQNLGREIGCKVTVTKL